MSASAAAPTPTPTDIFDHVMDNVLNRDDNSALKTTLMHRGYTDVPSAVSMGDDEIDDLKSDTNKKMSPGDMGLLKMLVKFNHFRILKNTSIVNPIDWLNVTKQEFDQFRVVDIYEYRLLAAGQVPGTLPVGNAPATTLANTTAAALQKPADMFRRAIKRDQSLFPELKNEELNDAWHRSFETQAHAQDVAEVLNVNYDPATQELIDLFAVKQTYVYAILESKVQTDRGRAIVRLHEVDRDAQQVYQKLRAHHTSSTKAKMNSSDLLTYITSAKLGSGVWSGSTEAFITHWQNQVRLYERLCEATERFSDGQKTTMLQNAVGTIDALAAVRQNAELERTKSGIALTYDQYCNLLTSAAIAYDQPSTRRRPPRTALIHEFEESEYYRDEAYNDDTPLSVILANAMQQRRSRPLTGRPGERVMMPKTRWTLLSSEARTVWDKLSDKDKAIILGQTDDQVPIHQRPPDQRPLSRRVNIHDISAIDLLQALIHDTSEQDVVDESLTGATTITDDITDHEQPDVTVDDSDSQLLINALMSKAKFRPGDLRRVLSSA
jgi:hypothetical protein